MTEADYTSGKTYQYSYDKVGNRLQQIIDGDTTTYQYDAVNRLEQLNGQSVYIFDNNGNLLNSDTLTNTFDAANRLIETERAGSTLEPVYNGVGDQVGQTTSVTTTYFALDVMGLPEVIYTTAGNLYLHLPSVIMAESETGDVRYLLSDGLGSVRQATDESGEVVAYNEFDPYGNPVQNDSSPYGFTGEWWESDVSLLHLRARWYAPETGTFLSVDPVESEPPYQYVRGNPINTVDPSGFYGKDVHYKVTFGLAYEAAASVGLDVPIKFSQEVAGGDQHVDDAIGTLDPVLGYNHCHFQPFDRALFRANEAIRSGKPWLFGATLHQFQDWFSHFNEGYDTRLPTWVPYMGDYYQHLKDSLPYEVNLPRGLGARETFFLVHPLEEVYRVVRAANPGLAHKHLSENDLIDLYLRQATFPSSEEYLSLDKHRELYRFHNDAYIEGSSRDTDMKQWTRILINRFLAINSDSCKIDWNRSDDAAIKIFLLN